MEKINKQHVQLPNNMTLDVKPKDLLIYVTIKRHLNSNTKKAFPALTTICAESGVSINSVRKSIDKLKQTGYISVEKEGRKNIYIFNDYKSFEPFSYEFLDHKDLSYEEKSYILASQQYMYKDIEGEGKISLTNSELSNKINITERSIVNYNNSLERKGFLIKCKSTLKDLETGCSKEIKIFNLNKLMQQVIWVLKNHEDRISNIEERMDKIEQENKNLKKENELLKKQLEKQPNNFVMN